MSSGAIKRKTPTFGLNIINYDFPRWHTFDWQNWDTLDAVLKAANLTAVKGVWQNNTSYLVGDRVVDDASSSIWICAVAHTSAASGTFEADRIANPTYWTSVTTLPIDRGNWVTAVGYNTWDIVKQNNAWYVCIISHTSGVFATDLAAGKWTLIFSVQPAIDAQTAAELAETNAETAESNASGYATAALGSKNAAAISESNAGTSEYNAGVSESNAAISANDALGYKNTAATKATEALNSATLAGQWATSLALVDGTNYGAKKYAIDAANSAAAAATFDPALYVTKIGGAFSGQVAINADYPALILNSSSAPAGHKVFNLVSSGGYFHIVRVTDGVGYIDSPFTIDHTSGIATFVSRPYWGGATPWDNANVALAGMLAFFVMENAPAGWLKANGAAVSLTTYPNLINIYCGDTNNAAASHGYRCTNPASPSSTRSTSGNYIVLPDVRGEFIRGWDDGRGVDSGRSLWAAQAQAIQNHTHTLNDPGHTHNVNWVGGASGVDKNAGGANNWLTPNGDGAVGINPLFAFNNTTGITVASSGGGAETRPRNQTALACIKY